MLQQISRFASSFVALLGPSADSAHDSLTEEIRDAMHEAIAPLIENTDRVPSIWRRIAVAPDIDSLWYLRGDLFAMLSESRGELSARTSLTTITEMFRGAIPDTLMPKNRRLGAYSS